MTKEQKYQNIIDGKTKITDQTWFTIIMLIIFFPYGLYLMWKKYLDLMIRNILVEK